ncbi:MAG: archaeosortase/exosortase family protein [Candidatus Zixiibacteriota bacterium]|nr:MAG: archaeosortase/exosortase family protein [candidate division Zixibacteria bacterium]
MANFTVAKARMAVIPATVALWPAWERHIKFGLDSFVVGLALFVFLCAWYVYEQRKISADEPATFGFMVAAWLLLVIYIMTFGRVPPLGGQVLATEIVACALLASYPPVLVRRRLAYLALCPLTLPLETALQFVIGYPFRRISAEAVGVLLSPYGVVIKGTTLIYGGSPLEVDAACSGVLGLWALLIIGALISLFSRYGWSAFLSTMTCAAVASLGYNILRTSLLFLYRFHRGVESTGMHSLLGGIAFVVTVTAFVAVARKGSTMWPVARKGCYQA